MAISEADLLQEAAEWLTTSVLNGAHLREVARQRGLDFATALLYQALCQSSRHGPLIASLERPAVAATSLEARVVVVPGAFYKEHPETGAAGRLLLEAARRLNANAVVAPLQSFGAVADNAELLADWLRQHRDRPMILASHSKGTTEVRHLLTRSDAPDLFRDVRGWLDISGLFHGTPLVGWLRRRPVNRWLVRLLFWWHGFAFAALDGIDRDSCPPFPHALDALPHLETVHVIGFPLERHLTTPLIRRGHRRLADLGPSDGTILLEDVLTLPGRVYPVWGADHYLQPPQRDMVEMVCRLLAYLGGAVAEDRESEARLTITSEVTV